MTPLPPRAVARRRIFPQLPIATLLMLLLAFNLVADILWRSLQARLAGAEIDGPAASARAALGSAARPSAND